MRHQIGFVLQTTKEGHGNTRRPGGGEMLEVGCDAHTGGTACAFIHGTQAFTHGLAQRGFVVHAFNVADRSIRAPF